MTPNLDLFTRKLHFLFSWVIFQMHFMKQILIFDKNPFAQQFLYIKAFMWPWSGYISKILTYPISFLAYISNSYLSVFDELTTRMKMSSRKVMNLMEMFTILGRCGDWDLLGAFLTRVHRPCGWRRDDGRES